MKRVDLNSILWMDSKIKHRSTGTPDEFAQRVGLSRSTLFEYLSLMRQDYGLVIEYDRDSQTYYYDGYDLIEAFQKFTRNSSLLP
jgi:DNA-binding IclR family transcriptional regulator